MSAPRSDSASLIPTLIPIEQFAAELREKVGPRGTSVGWLKQRAKRREFKHVYIGGRYYLTEEMVAEFMARHTQSPAEPAGDPDPLATTRARVVRERSRPKTPRQRGKAA